MVTLLHLPLLELAADMGMRLPVQRNHHDARRVQVQAMYDACRRVALLETTDQAVLVERVPPRNAEQQVGLAHQQQVGVRIEDTDLFTTVGDEVGGLFHGRLFYSHARR